MNTTEDNAIFRVSSKDTYNTWEEFERRWTNLYRYLREHHSNLFSDVRDHTHANETGGNTVDHVNLANKGTNTHAQIDSHIANVVYNCRFVTANNRVVIADSGSNGETTPANTNYALKFHVANGALIGWGYGCRQGYGGTTSAYAFNFDWDGANFNAYLDNTLIGAVSLTSDYRLKSNVSNLSDNAIDRVMKFRPIKFRWKNEGIFKDDGKDHEGFLANEIKNIIPSAVPVDKDKVDSSGRLQPQFIMMNEIIPTLVKAIQELVVRVEALEKSIIEIKAK